VVFVFRPREVADDALRRIPEDGFERLLTQHDAALATRPSNADGASRPSRFGDANAA
jgi:hypothetical protein